MGLPKTATTTFRQLVFPSHPDVAYLGVGAGYQDFDQVLKEVCFTDGPNYSAAQQRNAIGIQR